MLDFSFRMSRRLERIVADLTQLRSVAASVWEAVEQLVDERATSCKEAAGPEDHTGAWGAIFALLCLLLALVLAALAGGFALTFSTRLRHKVS